MFVATGGSVLARSWQFLSPGYGDVDPAAKLADAGASSAASGQGLERLVGWT